MSRQVSNFSGSAVTGRQVGRGRLCSIDLLPTTADAAIDEAAVAVLEKKATQTAILAVFNATLAELGAGPISSSAFNQWAKRVRAGRYQRRTVVPPTCPHCGAELPRIWRLR
jgi:hypothetical protein